MMMQWLDGFVATKLLGEYLLHWGKGKVVGRCFASSSSERGRASDGRAWRDGARSCCSAAWCPEEGENPKWAAPDGDLGRRR
jgi:hypothetical protein